MMSNGMVDGVFGAHGCDSPFHSPAQRFLLRGLARIYVQGRLMRYDVQRMDGWALSAHTGATFIFTHQHSVFTGGVYAHMAAGWDDEV